MQKRGTFDFLNPRFTSLYHKNSTNRTDFYSDGFFLVPKTVLVEEFLHIKTAHCATSLFSLPKIRKVSPFPLLLPFFAVLKRQLSRHRQTDWLDWLGLFWPILLVVQANPLIRALSTMVGFALNGYWQGFSL